MSDHDGAQARTDGPGITEPPGRTGRRLPQAQVLRDPSRPELPADVDLVCFSHLRWNFVFQRPQHLLSRFALQRRVFYVEEPVRQEGRTKGGLQVSTVSDNITVIVPLIPEDVEARGARLIQKRLIGGFLREHSPWHVFWYYTPMALSFTRHLRPLATVYDCMDELSGFLGAPEELIQLEKELLGLADIVFTGGRSLFEAKRHLHRNIHPFPSSVDQAHFGKARRGGIEPSDQAGIPHPRIGYFGVIDERLDRDLLDAAARARPDWHFVMVGPVVKIGEDCLPRAANIHYLGSKPYSRLPDYISGWDVAMMPFARNEATRFISPTKTPEYLAAGRPVVSTSIRDVVQPYGKLGLVRIADDADSFCAAAEHLLNGGRSGAWLQAVDAFLATMSWDATWREMDELMQQAVRKGAGARRMEPECGTGLKIRLRSGPSA